MINPKKIIKNSAFISSGVIVDGIILFVVFALTARYLPVEEFGRFVFLLSFSNIFQIFASGGIVNITIREIAKAKQHVQAIISSTLSLSQLVLLFLFLVLYAGVEFSLVDHGLKLTIYSLATAALIMVHAAIHAAVLRAHEDMGRVAVTAFLHKCILLISVAIAIFIDAGIQGIAFAYLCAAVVNWCAYYLWVRLFYTAVRWQYRLDYWIKLIQEAVPLGMGLVLRRLTIHIDTFLLTLLSTTVTVGLFNSAYRVTQMLEIGFVALCGVLFPIFSRLAKQSREEFNRIFNYSIRVFILLSLPIAVWLVILSDEIILLAYGETYAQSSHVLSILAMSLVIVLPGSLFFSVFSAIHKQRLFLLVTLTTLLSNFCLDYWLIPRYNQVGAAAATMAAEMISFSLAVILLYKQKIQAALHLYYLRCLLASILPGILLYYSSKYGDYLVIGASSLLYAALYLWIVFQLQLFHKHEWQAFVLSVKQKTQPRSCPT